MKIVSQIKNVSVYLLIILLTLLVAEVIFRAIFPEFAKNQVYYRVNDKNIISKGQNQYFNYLQDLKYRSKTNLEEKFDFNKKTIWLLGDSVTNGFGLKFTETYSFQLANILKNIGYDYNLITSSGYNSDLKKNVNVIISNKRLFNENDIIIYQFNYNDILPHTSDDITNSQTESFLKKFIKKTTTFRYAYLNRSTFARTLQHYAAFFAKKISGKCSERGLDALGQYTYAYGSRGYEKTSKKAWNLFYEDLKKTNEISKNLNLKFIVLISPISLQLPHHENNDKFNLDLNCATIDPYKKIKNMLADLNIEYSDPLPMFLEKINTDFDEQNFSQLFLDHDNNHPNVYGQLLLAYSLLSKLVD